MAMNFPNNPVVGQQYLFSGQTWQWDGTVWNMVPGMQPAIISDTPPPNPVNGQEWWRSTNGQLYIYYDDGNSKQWVQSSGNNNTTLKTARSRNRVNNPTAQVSQENGSTAVTGAGGYPADQWVTYFGGITASGQRVNVVSPEGTTTGVAVTATTAKASLAAGDYIVHQFPVEGLDVADLLWGTGAPKQIVLRFNAWCEQAGTYGFSIRNSASNRSYCGSFTCVVGKWTEVVVAIPGDATGTWLTDTGIGLKLVIAYAAGSTYIGAAGWQAGNFFAPAGCTNGAAVANSRLIITDVGLYADPDNTGLAPPFEAPSYEDDLARCQRYWVRNNALFLMGYNTSGLMIYETYTLPATMRVAPTCTFANLANIQNVTGLVASNQQPSHITAGVTISTTGTGFITFDEMMNARMI